MIQRRELDVPWYSSVYTISFVAINMTRLNQSRVLGGSEQDFQRDKRRTSLFCSTRSEVWRQPFLCMPLLRVNEFTSSRPTEHLQKRAAAIGIVFPHDTNNRSSSKCIPSAFKKLTSTPTLGEIQTAFNCTSNSCKAAILGLVDRSIDSMNSQRMVLGYFIPKPGFLDLSAFLVSQSHNIASLSYVTCSPVHYVHNSTVTTMCI